MQHDYGDVVRLRLWPDVCHLVSDPAEVARILVTDADRFHYVPVTAPEADPGPAPRFHQLARAVLHGEDGAAAQVPAMTTTIAEWLDDLGAQALAGRPVDMAHELVVVLLAVLGRSLLAEDLRGDATGGDLDRLARAFIASAEVGAPHRNVSGYQSLERRRAPTDPALTDAVATIGETVRRLIATRRRMGPGPGDLLTRLVFDDRTDAPNRLRTTEEVEAAVAVLLVAGHSAPASALAWTMHLVACHPDVRDRLEDEVDDVLGDRPPGNADLIRLRYTRTVLQEAMRLYPPVWLLLPRRTAGPEQIGGYSIAPGTKVLVSPWVLHRHPRLWADPTTFDPDRFARGEPGAYLPFGAGPWGCVGAQLGLLSTRLTLAMLLQRFRWTPAADRPVVPDPQLALWPRNGMPLTLRPRPHASSVPASP